MAIIVTKVETVETNIPISQSVATGAYTFQKFSRTRITCIDDGGAEHETEMVFDVPATSALATAAEVDAELTFDTV